MKTVFQEKNCSNEMFFHIKKNCNLKIKSKQKNIFSCSDILVYKTENENCFQKGGDKQVFNFFSFKNRKQFSKTVITGLRLV